MLTCADDSNFNSTLTAARKANFEGVYDIHTNVIQYPAVMQPTHARIEQVPPGAASAAGIVGQKSESTILPPLPPLVARNFLVTDIRLETPPTGIAAAAYDRPFRSTAPSTRDSSDFLAPFRGLGAVPDDIKDLLPEECRKAFDQAVGNENAWLDKWGTEKDKTSRRPPVVDKAIVPYSMLQHAHQQ